MKKKTILNYFYKKKRYLNKICGNSIKPRLSIFRSNIHIYAQLIDDQIGHTITSYSTLHFTNVNSKNTAFLVGVEIAKRALHKDILTIVFDRGQFTYSGRIQQLANGARSAGLIF